MDRISYLELGLLTNLCRPIQGVDSLHKSLKFDLGASIRFTNYLLSGVEYIGLDRLNDSENLEVLVNSLYKRMAHSYLLVYPRDGRPYDNVSHYFSPDAVHSKSVKHLVLTEITAFGRENGAKNKVDKSVTEVWSAVGSVETAPSAEFVFLPD